MSFRRLLRGPTWVTTAAHRFAGDRRPLQAVGRHLASFGGTWLVLVVRRDGRSAPGGSWRSAVRSMPRSRALLGLVTALGLLVAGCGSSGYGGGGAATAASSRAPAGVGTAAGGAAPHLVDGGGRTLYLFTKDGRGASACAGSCAQAWPPAVTRAGVPATGGARRAALGTLRRAGGALQLTYAGRPLYRYAGDGAPGAVKGQGLDAFGGRWWIVAPSGRAITASARASSPPPASSPPARSGGYGGTGY